MNSVTRHRVDPELMKLLRNMHRGAAGLADNLKKLIHYLDTPEGNTTAKH